MLFITNQYLSDIGYQKDKSAQTVAIFKRSTYTRMGLLKG